LSLSAILTVEVTSSVVTEIPGWVDRGTMFWNQRHRSANLLVENVFAGYGLVETVGGLTSYTTTDALVIAQATWDSAHAFPIFSRGETIKDLVPWLWMCACGGMRRKAKDRACLACLQHAGGRQQTTQLVC
jgi:hypothetical protein